MPTEVKLQSLKSVKLPTDIKTLKSAAPIGKLLIWSKFLKLGLTHEIRCVRLLDSVE